MRIQDWPVGMRPREKLLRAGPETLSDAELIAVFLRSGIRGSNAVALADTLLRRFDGIRGLLSASEQDACRAPGLGPARYAALVAALELAKRHLGASLERGNGLLSPADCRAYLKARLRDLPHEVFCCLFLDNRHRVLKFAEMFRGTIDGASVYPREVVKEALRQNAAAVILAHNHPSGVAEPSDADRRITERLGDALALVDIRLLDHFVIGDGEPVSFAERGLL
mgnify:CR=1 FL=1